MNDHDETALEDIAGNCLVFCADNPTLLNSVKTTERICSALTAAAKAERVEIAVQLRDLASTLPHESGQCATCALIVAADAITARGGNVSEDRESELQIRSVNRSDEPTAKKCSCQDEHRRGFCREPTCPYFLGAIPEEGHY